LNDGLYDAAHGVRQSKPCWFNAGPTPSAHRHNIYSLLTMQGNFVRLHEEAIMQWRSLYVLAPLHFTYIISL